MEARAFACQVCSEAHSHKGSVSSKGRQKAHELYSDQPGKPPADSTVGAGNNQKLVARRTRRLPQEPGGLRQKKGWMLKKGLPERNE